MSSTRELIGIRGFSELGIETTKGELVLYRVSPVNITVLSEINVRIKVRNLSMMLSSIPDIEMCCLNSAECFEDNKLYLQERIRLEKNPRIRQLLRRDLTYLDQIQIEMSTAREFLFIIRFRREDSMEQIHSSLSRIEKTMKEYGFRVHRASREEIKRILAIYFEGDTSSETFPDYDGEQWLTGGEQHEKETKAGASAGSKQTAEKAEASKTAQTREPDAKTGKPAGSGKPSKPAAGTVTVPRKPKQAGKPDASKQAGQKAKTTGEKTPE